MSMALAILVIAAILSLVLIDNSDGSKQMPGEQPCLEETQEPEASPSPTPTPRDTGAHIIIIEGTSDKSGPSKSDIVTIAVTVVTAIILGAGGVLGYLQLRQEMESAGQKAEAERQRAMAQQEQWKSELTQSLDRLERQRGIDFLDSYARQADSADKRGVKVEADRIRLEYEEMLKLYRDVESIKRTEGSGRIQV